MSRIVPFDARDRCDNCGALGAYDFMGDTLCPNCSSTVMDSGDDESGSPLGPSRKSRTTKLLLVFMVGALSAAVVDWRFPGAFNCALVLSVGICAGAIGGFVFLRKSG